MRGCIFHKQGHLLSFPQTLCRQLKMWLEGGKVNFFAELLAPTHPPISIASSFFHQQAQPSDNNGFSFGQNQFKPEAALASQRHRWLAWR